MTTWKWPTSTRIYVVPTLIIEKDKKEIKRIEGLTDAASLEAIMKPLVE